ncbi:MAG: heme ABC exporter ATP-binding protein CcmA [Pseudomonadota bacterium]
MNLAVSNLAVDRGERRIISDLTFNVEAGQALLLRGRNGAGKTTLIRTIAGFLTPASGEMRLDGGDEEQSLAEQAHYVGHLNGVKANLTVGENLDFWSRYLDPDAKGSERTMRIDDALETFSLLDLEDIPAAYLSAGQKRRVGLARLKLAFRALWLLDEPTVSLDVASVKILADAVQAHTTAGGIVIAATHIPLGIDKAQTLELQPHRPSPSATVGLF